MADARIDEIDAQLIRRLQVDGRRPYTQLAREVGLSEAAVRQRVQRLLDSGVMQIVAVTDPLQLGLHRQAMILIKVEGDVRDVAAELSAFDEVDYLVLTAGSVDISPRSSSTTTTLSSSCSTTGSARSPAWSAPSR